MLTRQTSALSILLFVGGCTSRGGEAGTGGIDASGCARRGSLCFDPNWADWPMPNLAADVADGAPNLENLEDNGDGTVTDGVTGLLWQQAATLNLYAWSDAVAFCSALVLAGRTDWRLPSAIELVSIVDYGQSNPNINGTYFPDAPPAALWSSSFGPTYAWKVDFSDGNTATADVTATYNVRCVAATGRHPLTRVPRWEDLRSPAELSPTTRRSSFGSRPRRRPSIPGRSPRPIVPAGAQGWQAWAGAFRPSGSFRRSSTPSRMGDPRADLTAFPDTPSAGFWSSSPAAGAPSLAWLVNFYDGFASKYDITTGVDVRCVR